LFGIRASRSVTLLLNAEVAQALAKLEFPHIYPDPEARRLRAALAADCGVPADNLMAGASKASRGAARWLLRDVRAQAVEQTRS
jgi:histidinol-phosphate/aromatic aminotransferase/cobyric acid decarboxylase-like protein